MWYNIDMNKKNILLVEYILSKLNGGVADYWKVYKLLYFIDFQYYSKHKKSITGDDYYNWEYGPMPYQKGNAEYINNNIINEGVKANLWRNINENTIQLIPGQNVTDQFNAEELIVIDEILLKYGALSGKELVDLSHEDMPWKMTKRGEKIDYDYVMWRETEPMIIEDITEQVV